MASFSTPGELMLFMTWVIIERIVDCTHFNKISTVKQLIKETCWTKDSAIAPLWRH